MDISAYLEEVKAIADKIDYIAIEAAIDLLKELKRRRGRLFILGNGGSAANASHAANDFRKIAGIEAYAPTDNVAELTAWINDDSWWGSLIDMLIISRINDNDMILILSVGGGSDKTSVNLVRAMDWAQTKNIKILSMVSGDGGRAKKYSDVCILIPVVNKDRITPHAESWQLILIHLLANLLEAS